MKINYIKHTLEQRKLATELAEQRKNDLVVFLAHDLKTPLTSVIGYFTLLRDENQISEELREKYLSISLEKNLQCELEITADTMVRCDVNKMQRVLDHLLRNAVNYSFEGSTVCIIATQNVNDLNIQFINNGNIEFDVTTPLP